MTNYRDYSQPNTTRSYDYDAPRGGTGALIAMAIVVLLIAGIVIFGASTSDTDSQTSVAPTPDVNTTGATLPAEPAPAGQ